MKAVSSKSCIIQRSHILASLLAVIFAFLAGSAYALTPAAVVKFSPASGYYTNFPVITLWSATQGATIRYTTNGDIPTVANGTIYTKPFKLLGSVTTVKAIAYLPGSFEPSPVASSGYVFKVGQPVMMPPAGIFSKPTAIYMYSPTYSTTIRYTTDGSTPTESSSIYTKPLYVGSPTTIKALTFRDGYSSSAVVSQNYRFSSNQVAPLEFTPSTGYALGYNVTLKCATQDAQIYYTTDGSTPSYLNGQLYNGRVVHPYSWSSVSCTIKAIGYKNGMAQSEVASLILTKRLENPEIKFRINDNYFASSATNYMHAPTDIRITSNLPEAIIRYTIDGTTPSLSNGTTYTGEIFIDKNTRLNVMAYTNQTPPQQIYAGVDYEFITPVVSISPGNGGVFSNSRYVSMSTVVSEYPIYYTTDGTLPSKANATLYTGSCVIKGPTTLNAIAYSDLYGESQISTKTYSSFKVGAIYFRFDETSEPSKANVSLMSATGESTIRYTLDGTIPTATTGFLYTGPFTAEKSATINAKGYRDQFVESDLYTGVYSPYPNVVPLGEWTEPVTGMDFVLTPSGLLVGKYEVTQAQYKALTGTNPSWYSNETGFPDSDNRPVENVTLAEIDGFIALMNVATGLNFRLPTVAEWESAAGGGLTTFVGTSNYYDSFKYAWLSKNSGYITQPVGTRLPNLYGIYDIGGNVGEITSDYYIDEEGYVKYKLRAYKGGSWRTGGSDISGESGLYYLHGSALVGFRLVLEPN